MTNSLWRKRQEPEALKRITRDDTEHDRHYYLADEVDALLAQPEQNLNCKSTQARLATAWGYVKAEQEPVLQNIEQYRLQMAGISTAAIGYWKESDGIHPDYDTIALRDVAKLYEKYDELYRAQPAQQEPVAWRAPNWGHGDDEWVYRDFDDPVLIADGKPSPNNEALYTTPPQRLPLTDEMRKQMKEHCDSMEMRGAFVDGWLSAESAHGIKE